MLSCKAFLMPPCLRMQAHLLARLWRGGVTRLAQGQPRRLGWRSRGGCSNEYFKKEIKNAL